jgi:hypothetical protein
MKKGPGGEGEVDLIAGIAAAQQEGDARAAAEQSSGEE